MALTYIHNAEEEHSNSANLVYSKAVAIFQMADQAKYFSEKLDLWQRAEQHFKLCMRRGYAKYNVKLYLALVLSEQGKLEEAMDLVRVHYALEDPIHAAVLALIHFAEESYSTAREITNSALKLHPNNVYLYTIKVLIKLEHLKLGQSSSTKSALQLLKIATMEDMDENSSNVSLEGALGLHVIREEPSSRYDLVETKKSDEKWLIASEDPYVSIAFECLITVGHIEAAEALVAKAKRAKSRNLMKAILSFKKSGSMAQIERLPFSLERQVALLDLYDGDKLLSAAKNAIKFDNRCKKAWTKLGELYEKNQEYELATDAFLKVLEIKTAPFGLIPKTY